MSWDYIIVGAGSGGCALAYELVRSGKCVLVLEAGGWDRSPYIKVASGQVRACEKHDWGYRSQPDPTRNGATDFWLRGRVVGGSSSINGTMYTRGIPADFNRWNLPGWSWEDVLPIFRELENSDQPGPSRGHHGTLHVRTVKHPHAITDAFVESAHAAGLPFQSDYNGEAQEGVAYAQLTQRRGFRCSAADAFLKPVLGSKNLTLLLDTVVERIEIRNGRAIGVSFSQSGVSRFEVATDVILCAGAINSPKLLMLSGVGDLDELKRRGVDVTVSLPGVGRNLKEQPLVSMLYRSKVETYNLTGGLLQKARFAAQFLAHGEGPISNLFEGAAFLKSSAEQPLPDLQVIFTAFGYVVGDDGLYSLAPYPAVMLLFMQSYPANSGRIKLASQNPADSPIIECPLLQAQSDVDSLVGGLKIGRKIMQSEPIASLLQEEVEPGPALKDTAALEAYVRNHTKLSYHPIGTCRMGMGDDAVVGPDLRVRGIENLWVADASIIPDHMSANMNAICIMIGKKLGKALTLRDQGAATSPASPLRLKVQRR